MYRHKSIWKTLFIVITLVLAACQPVVPEAPTAQGDLTQVQTNVETSRQFTEVVWAQGNVSRLDEFVAEDVVYHTHTPGVPPGQEGMAAEVNMIHAGLSDVETTIHDIFGEGDLVAARWTLRGTHTGELMGAAGTDQEIAVPGTSIYRFAEGRIVEEWSEVDMVGLLTQLGVMPPMGEPGQESQATVEPEMAATAEQVTPEQLAANKEIARRLSEELWGQGNLDLIDELYADEVAYHDSITGGPPTLETLIQDVSTIQAALSDIESSVQTVVAAGDSVAARWSVRATHTGDGLGIPPTGRDIAITGISIYQIADGRVVQEWSQPNLLGLLSQLGAIPPAAVGDPGTGDVNTVTFTAADFSFIGPDSIPAGWTRIQLVNEGMELHHAQLLRLPEDKTMADLMQALQEDPEHPPQWLSYAGGPSVVVPGESVSAVVNLEPGNYVLICVLPDAEGIPHAAHGMIRPLQVVDEEMQADAPPEADITMELFDYDFTLSGPITSGRHTFHVINNGPQPHEVAVVWLAPGVSVEGFLAAVESGLDGPPPGKPLGGLQVIDSGAEGYFTVDFAPGEYALICFHPDEGTGAPHFAHGMVQQFTVE